MSDAHTLPLHLPSLKEKCVHNVHFINRQLPPFRKDSCVHFSYIFIYLFKPDAFVVKIIFKIWIFPFVVVPFEVLCDWFRDYAITFMAYVLPLFWLLFSKFPYWFCDIVKKIIIENIIIVKKIIAKNHNFVHVDYCFFFYWFWLTW